MPLNPNGEHLDGLGTNYRVASVEKWKGSSLYDEAATAAENAFKASGALVPIRFNDNEVGVQEYPSLNKVAFIFLRAVAGREMFYPYVFDIHQSVIGELRAAGLWSQDSIH